MAYDIGPRIGIDGESEFRKQLNKINTEIKTLGTELKATSSAFGENAQSQQALIAKSQVLEKAIAAENKKIAEVTKMLNASSEKYGENSIEAMKWQQVLNRSKTALNGMEAELKQNEKALAEMETGLRDAETGVKRFAASAGDIDSVGSALRNAAKTGAGYFAKAAVGLATAIGSVTEGTREFREDFGRLQASYEATSRSTKTTEKAFESLYSVIGETDQAVEAAQQITLLAQSEKDVAKWAQLAAGVTGKFGDALMPETFFEAANETLKLGEATGAYTQMLEGSGMSVDAFNKGLAACSTEAEKQAYMLATTEKALGAAGESYKKYNGDVMEANKAQLALTQSLARLGASFEPIMSVIKNVLADALGVLAGIIERFTQLPTALQASVAAIAGLATAAVPVISTIVKLKTGTSAFGSIAATLAPKLAAAGAAIAGMAAPIALAVAAIAGIVSAILALWKTNEDFRTAVLAIWETVKSTIRTAASQIRAIIQSFIALTNAIWNAWGAEITAVVKSAMAIISTVIKSALNIIKNAIKLVTAVLKGDWKGAWTSAKNIAKNVMAGLKTIAASAFSAIVTVIKGFAGKIGAAVSAAFNSAVTYIKGLPSKAVQWGSDFINGLISGIKAKVESVISTVKGLADKIASYLHFSRPDVGPLHYYESWMPDFMKGLANGIRQNTGVVERAVNGVASAMDLSAKVERVTAVAQNNFSMQLDYERLASLMNQGIYIEGRQIGRALREAGVVVR